MKRKSIVESAIKLREEQLKKYECSSVFMEAFSEEFDKRLNEILFIRQEAGVLHNSFEWVYRVYESVKNNDRAEIIERLNDTGDVRYGVLSNDPLRSGKNLLITLISTICSFAMYDRLIEPETAFSVADACILIVENADSREELMPIISASMLKIAEYIDQRQGKQQSYLVIRTKEYVYKHFHEKISEKEIARKLEVSPEHLSRVFSTAEGISLRDFIQKERIERCKNMLVNSDCSIEEIGTYMSFASQSHFTRMFKKHTRLTPLKYRAEFSHEYRKEL